MCRLLGKGAYCVPGLLNPHSKPVRMITVILTLQRGKAWLSEVPQLVQGPAADSILIEGLASALESDEPVFKQEICHLLSVGLWAGI